MNFRLPTSYAGVTIKHDSFIDPILDSFRYDHIAFVGLDFTGAHTAAHMAADYLRINGMQSLILRNVGPGRQSLYVALDFLRDAETKIKTKSPGEKLIVSYRIRRFAPKEIVDFLKRHDFKVFLFEPRSYSHASLNWSIFLGGSSELSSLPSRDFQESRIPKVKVNLGRIREEFDKEWRAYQSVKSMISEATLLHFNETEYQNFIRTKLAGYPTWREPYLVHPESKIIDPENIPIQPIMRVA